MKARRRSPATFRVEGYSGAFKTTVEWRVIVTESGIQARRLLDGREISIDWRQLLGTAMFYGHDSLRGERTDNLNGGKI